MSALVLLFPPAALNQPAAIAALPAPYSGPAKRFHPKISRTLRGARTNGPHTMSNIKSMESLQVVLEPLGAVRTENEDLGEWIHESFSALEKLHEELTQWQSELARKETELNLRTDALEKCPQDKSEVEHQITKLENELATAKEDAKVLEQEKSQQLLQYENLVSKYAQVKSEILAANEQVRQLVATIESQRHSAEKSRELWQKEFQLLHLALDNHHVNLLAELEKSMNQGKRLETEEPDLTKTIPSAAKSLVSQHRKQSRQRSRK